MADLHGPLFNGVAERAVLDLAARIEREVGAEGADAVRARLGEVLQHPTGYYESHIHAEPDGGDVDVTDGGIVYGPWLEGTGSRNRTTRFKGYGTFRRVAQALDRRAEHIAEQVTPEYVRRMG
jgi:hypothetical protein